MERIRKVGTTLRTHWKKSVFLSLASVYGVKWYMKKLDDKELMRNFCREALTYGAAPIGVHQKNYHVTVILNPASSGGKARKLFEQYSAPILHLAGFKVSIQKTEGREEAKELMKIMDNCDAVLVGGGDGTLMEAITGLMKREDFATYKQTPIGIIPLGMNNYLANRLFPFDDQVKQLAEASMAVVKQLKRPVSVIEVKNLADNPVMYGKKIYGVAGLQMGAWREAEARKDSYWFFAGLKDRMTYVFSYLTGQSQVTWDWPISIVPAISSPLAAAAETRQNSAQQQNAPNQNNLAANQSGGGSNLAGILSWFGGGGKNAGNDLATNNGDVSRSQDDGGLMKMMNYEWGSPVETEVGEIDISVEKCDASEDVTLTLKTLPNKLNFTDYVAEGWKRIDAGKQRRLAQNTSTPLPLSSRTENLVEADQMKLDVYATDDAPKMVTFDGEEVELTGPIKLSLLRNYLTMFCQETDAINKPGSNSQESGSSTPQSRWTNRGGATSTLLGTGGVSTMKPRI
eukprot:TRINITY_DN4398_c0_g1_i6.p1 TRINITY_DN4398_c0_g1~~TRINITY_DN4398_c0_g1_i6.p1  ORF type:complete len:514 (+),score=84.47 TRINITY_DN4398_c0_g1_i6:50-1591(+)